MTTTTYCIRSLCLYALFEHCCVAQVEIIRAGQRQQHCSFWATMPQGEINGFSSCCNPGCCSTAHDDSFLAVLADTLAAHAAHKRNVVQSVRSDPPGRSVHFAPDTAGDSSSSSSTFGPPVDGMGTAEQARSNSGPDTVMQDIEAVEAAPQPVTRQEQSCRTTPTCSLRSSLDSTREQAVTIAAANMAATSSGELAANCFPSSAGKSSALQSFVLFV